MPCNLVHWVSRGRFALLALVAACAVEEPAREESGDAQSSGVASESSHVGATGGATPGSAVDGGGRVGSAVAGSGAKTGVGPAAGSGVVPAAGSGAGLPVAGGNAASGTVPAAGSGGVSAGAAGGGAAAPADAEVSGSAGASGALAAGAGGGAGASGSSGGGALGAAGAAASGGAITVWLAGDSTVAKGNTPCPVGWGAEFQDLFKPEAKVVNSAVGGRSVRTWLYEVQTQMDSTGECGLNKDSSGKPVLQARWQMMLDGMKMGDYLFIQFGINDSSATCDRHVGIEAFKESYGMMAEAAKMRGAQPVFVTPVSAIACSGSMAKPTRGNFVTATIDAGKKYDVPVIDLHERSIALYNQQGLCPIPGGSDVSASTGGKTGAFFCDDHTHFSAEGAAQIAELMAQALKDEKLGLAEYLR